MLLPSSAIEQWEARTRGYRPLTVAYLLPDDRAALDAVQRDLDSGKIDYCLVKSLFGKTKFAQSFVEVWRKKMIVIANDEEAKEAGELAKHD